MFCLLKGLWSVNINWVLARHSEVGIETSAHASFYIVSLKMKIHRRINMVNSFGDNAAEQNLLLQTSIGVNLIGLSLR